MEKKLDFAPMSIPSSKRPQATSTKRSPKKQVVEKNTHKILRDLNEIENEEVP